jgi:hypothetical protein
MSAGPTVDHSRGCGGSVLMGGAVGEVGLPGLPACPTNDLRSWRWVMQGAAEQLAVLTGDVCGGRATTTADWI